MFNLISYRHKEGISILSNLYKDNAKRENEISLCAARELAQSKDGRNVLIDIIKQNDPEIQFIAFQVLTGYCISDYRIREETESYLETVRSFVFNENDNLSKIAIDALHQFALLNQDEVFGLIQKKNFYKKTIALEALRYLDIEINEERNLLALVVQELESSRIEISKAALQGISFISRGFPKRIATEIIEGLVIRSRNYPKEFFNTSVTISALQETFKQNPRLPGEILHKLCDIAYNSSKDVRNRSVFVAIGINKKEFLALVTDVTQP